MKQVSLLSYATRRLFIRCKLKQSSRHLVQFGSKTFCQSISSDQQARLSAFVNKIFGPSEVNTCSISIPEVAMADQESERHSSILSAHPVSVPQNPALTISPEAFKDYLGELVLREDSNDEMQIDTSDVVEQTPTETSTQISGFSDLGLRSTGDKDEPQVATEELKSEAPTSDPQLAKSPFIEGLKSYQEESTAPVTMENKMFTENLAIAHRSTEDPLVDLFYELEKVASPVLVRDRLESAWARDKEATLRIIFNSRSIHLGKSDRKVFYRCCGWLAENHPKTLILNLEWLCRRIIEKPKPKSESKKGQDNDSKQPETEAQPDTIPEKAVEVGEELEHGLSHGYWKDILNILALAVNGELKVLGNLDRVLNVTVDTPKKERDWSKENAKKRRSEAKFERHKKAVELFNSSPFYRALHLTVARLFADQLKTDKALLDSDKKESLANISLCAKWAPTNGGFHDEHTFVASSIAEILHPASEFPEIDAEKDREMYLKHARERCRYNIISPLRKYIGIVEHNITTKTYGDIKYERIPSLAMRKYSKLFIMKDSERYEAYLDKVLEGKSKISGATLLPSTLISAVRDRHPTHLGQVKGMNELLRQRERLLHQKTADGQWNTLVQRIKNSGTLSSAIAICDVSGSMYHPTFPDETCPMDSSVGLSLLLAEVTEPPFGGHFITFSDTPELVQAGGPGDKRTLSEKVTDMEKSHWSMNTDFEAVFNKLIIPMAKKNNLKKEDMVKTLFVFTDMQFDSALARSHSSWDTTYDRIKEMMETAKYDMPQIVFWNLAGGRAGYGGYKSDAPDWGDSTAPKPVTAAQEGTSLVSGYSQGQLKVFLDGGGFEEPEEAVEIVVEEKKETNEDGEEEIVQVKKRVKIDPLITVKKAINHPAYAVLSVVD